ncbi:MAG: FG-GAP-like repeat-containing protein [Kofleriaceae bacterium]
MPIQTRSRRARARHSLLALSLAVTGCAVDADLAPPADDDPGPATTTSPGVAPPTTAPDGDQLMVHFPWGRQLEAYEVIDGYVVIRGDIIVGRADRLGQRSTARVGRRWPGGVVKYAIDASIPLGDVRRTNLATATAWLEARTPLDFQLIANPCTSGDDDCATDYILVQSWNQAGGQSATPAGAGTVGYLGGQQLINAAANFGVGGFEHELLHAIGMYHEQERNDRDGSVVYRAECVQAGKTGNFGKNADPNVDFGSYDLGSIMQYSSATFRLTNPAPPPCNGGFPLTRKPGTPCPAGACSDPDGDGFADIILGAGTPSARDVDAVWAMYAPGLTAHESGDGFGRALAYGDFDGDGRVDVAVGTPYEDTVSNTVNSAGAVTLWKGTEDGLQPWRLITQGGIGALEEAGDRFGAALAVGDFDHDGVDDLAIGTPGESVGSNPDPNAGAVYLLRGGAAGPTYWRSVTEANVAASVEGDDRFGEALAVGDFDGDGVDDLAVGAPGETHGDGIAAGHVYVLRGTGAASALAAWTSVGQADLTVAPNVANGPVVAMGTNQAGDNFGAALAAGRIDADGRDDLVVGASCDNELATCAGGAYLYRGHATGMRGWMRITQTGGGGDAFDRFGFAVAVGDVDNDGDRDVLIGAPYDDVSGVTNVGRVFWARPQGASISSVSAINQVNSDWGTGDLFGYAIAIGQTGAFDAIAIGTPGEAWGTGPAAGAVMMFHASDSGPVSDGVVRAAPVAVEEAEDSFGFTVALAADHGQALLAVGNPGEDASAGAIMHLVASPIGTDFQITQSITQATPGTRAD